MNDNLLGNIKIAGNDPFGSKTERNGFYENLEKCQIP